MINKLMQKIASDIELVESGQRTRPTGPASNLLDFSPYCYRFHIIFIFKIYVFIRSYKVPRCVTGTAFDRIVINILPITLTRLCSTIFSDYKKKHC